MRPIELIPMDDADFAGYIDELAPEYADDKIRSGQWTAQEAHERSRSELLVLLPQGVRTAGHDFFVARDGESGARVGYLWIAVQMRGGRQIAFVYDVSVVPPCRRHGYGKRMFEALERLAVERGLAGVALHVFGHNTGGRAFYDAIGFTATNLDLYKSVDADR